MNLPRMKSATRTLAVSVVLGVLGLARAAEAQYDTRALQAFNAMRAQQEAARRAANAVRARERAERTKQMRAMKEQLDREKNEQERERRVREEFERVASRVRKMRAVMPLEPAAVPVPAWAANLDEDLQQYARLSEEQRAIIDWEYCKKITTIIQESQNLVEKASSSLDSSVATDGYALGIADQIEQSLERVVELDAERLLQIRMPLLPVTFDAEHPAVGALGLPSLGTARDDLGFRVSRVIDAHSLLVQARSTALHVSGFNTAGLQEGGGVDLGSRVCKVTGVKQEVTALGRQRTDYVLKVLDIDPLLDVAATPPEPRPAYTITADPDGDDGAQRSSRIAESLRTWIDTSGKFTIQARYAGFIGGQVQLEKLDGSKVTVAPRLLSPADRDYLKQVTDGAWDGD